MFLQFSMESRLNLVKLKLIRVGCVEDLIDLWNRVNHDLASVSIYNIFHCDFNTVFERINNFRFLIRFGKTDGLIGVSDFVL